MTGIVLRLCDTCDGPDWQRLDAALAAADLPESVTIKAQSCMNGCDAPVTLSLQSAGRATYFFKGVDPEADADDIVATLRTYLAAPDGWITDARPCGRLRLCLAGRVPAL